MLGYRSWRLEMKPVAWNEATLSTAMRDPVALEFWKIVCVGDFEDQKSLFAGPHFRSILGVTENGSIDS